MLKKEITEFIKSPIGKWVVRALVVLVATGGIVIAEKFINNDKTDNEAINMPPQQAQQASPTANQEPAPSESASVAPELSKEDQELQTKLDKIEILEKVPTVEELEVDASLMSDPAAVVDKILVQGYNKWINSGGTMNNRKDWKDSSNMTALEYATSIAPGYDKVFEDAFFVDSWEDTSNPLYIPLHNMSKINRKNHINTLTFSLLTLSEDNSYRRMTELTNMKVVSSTPKSLTVDVTLRDVSNSHLNRAGSTWKNSNLDDEGDRAWVDFIVKDGKVKIQHIK